MSQEPLLLDGRHLSLEAVRAVATGRPEVGLHPGARRAMEASRRLVQERVAAGEPVYGVTTGFGRLAEVVISGEARATLQLNLLRSHAVGLGAPLSVPEVRTIIVLRANALARGASGIRVEVVERLLDMLAWGWTPVVPGAGSVGASGDLAPLAHVALTLLGEGRVEVDGSVRAVRPMLEEAGREPLTLEAKEGLALINGTQATTGIGILALLQAEDALAALEAAAAMSLEALKGTPEAFRPEVSELRPHPGQRQSAALQRRLLRDSAIRESHRTGDPRIQDAYALRCIPQVHGAARQALAYVRGVLETEANSVTDNPLILAEVGAVTSAGNFHAQVVSQALDFAAIAIADLAAISERRVERLLNPDLSQGLPAFLAHQPGLESGFMIAQVTACDLLAEMRVLAHPASVDSVPTSAGQEDHISMGLTAARKLRRGVECLQYVVAIELAAAAQGLEYRRPLTAGVGVEAAHAAVREVVAPLSGDRSLAEELEALRLRVAAGRFRTDVLDPGHSDPPSDPGTTGEGAS
ncbi:MAG: histidine ammonia-lyase [Longimicrobiales bacterium]|nr:histidine ammonia-lyase [Longimicrobiales bacterium]